MSAINQKFSILKKETGLRWTKYRMQLSRGWALYKTSWLGIAGLCIVLAFTYIAIFAPLFVSHSPTEPFAGATNEEPSMEHLLGTDTNGRDIFSRIVWGTRLSIIIGFSASLISVLIGTLIGLVSGYIGGATDTILMRFTDLIIQLPTLPLMLILIMFWGRGILNLIIVIGVLGWTGTARIVRAETLSLKHRPFVEATRAIGARDAHIIFMHILPNVLPVVFANAILGIVGAILAEAGLSFLGFGDPTTPSWGMVLNDAQTNAALMLGNWWWFVPPGLCILTFVFGFALIGYSLNQLINPRLRER